MARWRSVVCGVLSVVLLVGLAPMAEAEPTPLAGAAASPRPGEAWKPESERSWWDRAKAWLFEEEPEDRELAAGGVPQRDPQPKAQKVKPAKRVKELADRRTATTKTFELTDGRLEQELSAVPVHYQDGDGDWKSIDQKVIETDRSGFDFKNTTNTFRSHFGADPGKLVEFRAEDAKLTLGVRGGERTVPEAKGNQVGYTGVLPDADLAYEVTRSALKEKIVLAERPSDGTFEFTLRPEGLRAWQRPDGSIAFYAGDFDAAPLLVMPKPFMYDSAPDASSPTGTSFSGKVSQSMRWDAKAGLLHVTVKADEAWLSDAKRVYPAVIDPTIKIVPTPTQSQDTQISSDGPDTNYDDIWRLSVGATNTGVSRALVKFGLDTVPAGVKIDSAQLRLYYDQNHTSNDFPLLMEAHRATQAWDETTATWNNANTKLGELSGTTEVIDDGDAGKTAQTGTWARTITSSDGSAVNNDFLSSKNATTGDSHTWTPKIIDPGQYIVSAHYRQHADGAPAAPYTVTFSGGSQGYTVDQSAGTASSGVWKTLGTHNFAAGTAGNIKLGDVASSTQRLIADAVRLHRPGTAFKAAGDEGSRWHTFSVKDTVQGWMDGANPNHGFMVKEKTEAPGQGGPRYEGSLFYYQGETATYPQLVITYGRPSVELRSIDTIRATGADLSWPAYADPSASSDDDAVEYQLHRSVWQTFTPSQATLVAPLPSTARSYSDTSAPPTPAADPDPFGNSFYYMLAVKTRDGEVIPGPTQLVRLPKAGRVTKIYQAANAADDSDTTVTENLPDTNHDDLAGQSWLMAGNNSATYGRSRSLVKFPALSAIPAGVSVTDAQVKVWTAGVDPGGQATYELRGLTRAFDEMTATWNKANATTAWTTPGGDFESTVSGTAGNWSNDPSQRALNATALVRKWVADPASNKGAVIKLANETTPAERAVLLSSEASERQLRPQLVVSYLEQTPASTYSVPATPRRLIPGDTYTIDVTLSNTTATTWKASEQKVSYRWALPDGTDATTSGNQLQTVLPRDVPPGDTVTVKAQLKTPIQSAEGNKRTDYVLSWDLWNSVTSTWLSGSGGIAALAQNVAVEDPTSNQLGLEKFYDYAGKNTGAGGSVMNNLYAGNNVWSYSPINNPGRGVSTFFRLAYNSLDTSDSGGGYGWSLQASAPLRLGSPLDFHPNPNPTEVTMTDGDGTSHIFAWDAARNEWKSPRGIHYFLQRQVDCGPKTEESRAWVMTRPDRTRFFYDCDGYLSAIVDKNGNTQNYVYERRHSNNKPIKFLRYITDPETRQTLTIDYWDKGDDYTWIDDAGVEQSGTNLTQPHIIDHVRSVTDISGRTLTFTYTTKGLLAKLVDGAGSIKGTPKVFKFGYDATQGNKNVKLVTVTDPRAHDTKLGYYDRPEDDPKFKWRSKTITDRLQGLTQFTYTDPDGTAGSNIHTVVADPETRTSTHRIDGFGLPFEITNAKNQTTKLGWDAENNVIRLEEPPATAGATPAVSTWTYDPLTGYPTLIKDAEANKNGTAGTVLTYQSGLGGRFADLIGKQSPEGRRWAFTYDLTGNLKTVTDPMGVATPTGGDFETVYDYDGFGRLTKATDANGNATANGDFHAVGYPKTITDARGKATRFVYDDRGQVTKVTDPLSHDTTQDYDTFGRPLANVTPKDQAAGVLITTPAPAYDANDNVLKAFAPNGAESSAVYDDADQLSSSLTPPDVATDPAPKTSYVYDKAGNVTSVTEPRGNDTPTVGDYTTTYGYNEIYQQTAVTNARGDKTSYAYDDTGNVATVVDARKNATPDTTDFTSKYTYDLNHRPTVVTDAIGKTTKTGYDRDGLVKTTTDQENNTTTVTLDARGKPFEVTVPHRSDGGTPATKVTRYLYDEVGNQTKVVSPRGVATTGEPSDYVAETVYDELNRVKEKLTPFNPADTRYNAPNKTIYDYDDAGRVAKVSAPPSEGQSVRNDTTYSHFDNGWVKTSTDPWDIVTTYDYNELGKQTSRELTSAGGSSSRKMTWGYLPDGKLRSRTDDGVPVGKQVVLADDSDRQNAGGSGGTWTARSTGTGFQGHGYSSKAAGTGASSFGWNLTIPQDGTYEVFVKHPTVAASASSVTYTVTHSTGSAPKTVNQTTGGGTWKSLGSFAFKRDGTGQKITLSDQAAAGTTVNADAVKLVRAVTETDNEKADFTYAYNSNGLLNTINDRSPGTKVGLYTVAYNQINLVVNVQEKNGTTVEAQTAFAWDPNGNTSTRTHSTKGTVDQDGTYEYDARDLPSKITDKDSTGDASPEVTTFTYTSRGQRDVQTKPNSNTVDHDYFLDGALAQQVEKKTSGALVAEHTYTYDPNGNKTRDVARKMNADNNASLLNTTSVWDYDPLDRIAKLTKTGSVNTTETYTHDANNNVVSQTVKAATTSFTYDRNRLLTSSTSGVAAAYNYDPFGRLDTITSAGNVVERNTYDGFDHVVENQKRNSADALTSTKYTYDPLDRTTSKTTNAGQTSAKTTDYAYLGLSEEVLTEAIASKITKTYQYSPAGERLSQTKVNDDGTKENGFYGYNDHTDVETLTTDTGDTKATYGYTAYGQGEDTETTGIDKPDPQDPTKEPLNPYRFNSKRWDSAAGKYDMGFRDYDPGLNRFTTRDTYTGALNDLGLGADPTTGNRYAFGAGNPVGNIELDGHKPHCGAGCEYNPGTGKTYTPPPGKWRRPRLNLGHRQIEGPSEEALLDALKKAHADNHGDAYFEGCDVPYDESDPLRGTNPCKFEQGMVADAYYQVVGDAICDEHPDWCTRTKYSLSNLEWGMAAGGFGVGAGKGGRNSLQAPGGLRIGDARYAQKSFSERFGAKGRFKGRTIDDVAGSLRSGAMSPQDVPINVIVRDGNTLILNTRSAQALTRAGIPRASWNVRNQTGDVLHERLLDGQLRRNGLDSSGYLFP